MNHLNLEDYFVLGVETREVKAPRRVYKNPVLQRLANRWYGMDVVGMQVHIEAVPTRSELRFMLPPKISAKDLFEQALNHTVQIEVQRVPLTTQHLATEVPIEAWQVHEDLIVKQAEQQVVDVLHAAGKKILEDINARSV